MMKIMLIVTAVLVGLALLVTAIGAMLPQKHTATRQARIRATPEKLWALIDGPQEWRSTVKKYELLPEENGRKRWRETDAHGEAVIYEAVERTPPVRMKSRIATAGLPYGGTWTFELEHQGGETLVRITEDGEVYNPVFRFVGRFILGYESSIVGYLEDLERAVSRP